MSVRRRRNSIWQRLVVQPAIAVEPTLIDDVQDDQARPQSSLRKLHSDLADLVGAGNQPGKREDQHRSEEVPRPADARGRPDRAAGQLVDSGIVGFAVPDRPPHGASRFGAFASQLPEADVTSDQLHEDEGQSAEDRRDTGHYKNSTQVLTPAEQKLTRFIAL